MLIYKLVTFQKGTSCWFGFFFFLVFVSLLEILKQWLKRPAYSLFLSALFVYKLIGIFPFLAEKYWRFLMRLGFISVNNTLVVAFSASLHLRLTHPSN